MKHTVIGIFHSSDAAGKAIAELKNLNYTKDVSVLSKDSTDESSNAHQIKSDLGADATKGASSGSVIGGIGGAIVGLLAGATAFSVPGIGIAVLGPLAATLAAAGAGGGAGAVIGALVGMGIPSERAKEYKEILDKGEILVAVTVDPKNVERIEQVMDSYQDRNDVRNAEYSDYAVHSYQY